jgi:preprotein translocase subunit YajC
LGRILTTVESLPFFVLILVAFYLLIIRPQRARAKAAQQLQESLVPGTEVMTTAGLYGTLTEVRDDSVLLEVAPGVTLRFTKAAVGRVVTDDAADDEAADDDAADDDAVESQDSADADRRHTNAAE